MNMIEIIAKKRDNKTLNENEIHYWIKGVSDQTIPDYQSAALLMAIVCNGLISTETAQLTEAMKNSGDVIDLSSIDGIPADKHSTGGVGDKTSLVLGPLVAACGGKVAKMSGRGLGHTGGTIDKLESILGFDVGISNEDFIKQVNHIGLAIIGQTQNLVPADKVLYSLRDVTATVPSIPLIASSIMSKKLAAGAQTILLDVKYGDGAFMHTPQDAIKLANAMIDIGKFHNKNIKAMITDMNQPLGYAIGNALELKEAIATLSNHGPADLTELTLEAASIMLVQSKVFTDQQAAKKACIKALETGKAKAKLAEMIAAQHGDASIVDNPEKLPSAAFTTKIFSTVQGYLKDINTEHLGLLSVELGAGRKVKTDFIDHAVGFVGAVKIGEAISKDQELITIYHNHPLDQTFKDAVLNCFILDKQPVATKPIIHTIL